MLSVCLFLYVVLICARNFAYAFDFHLLLRLVFFVNFVIFFLTRMFINPPHIVFIPNIYESLF